VLPVVADPQIGLTGFVFWEESLNLNQPVIVDDAQDLVNSLPPREPKEIERTSFAPRT
jgi:hypothetical protein